MFLDALFVLLQSHGLQLTFYILRLIRPLLAFGFNNLLITIWSVLLRRTGLAIRHGQCNLYFTKLQGLNRLSKGAGGQVQTSASRLAGVLVPALEMSCNECRALWLVRTDAIQINIAVGNVASAQMQLPLQACTSSRKWHT